MRFIYIIIISFITFVACSSDVEPQFEVENEIDFILPGGLNAIETHVFVIRNVPTFFESSLINNGMRKEDVVSISPGRATLTGKFNDADYKFIEEISIRVLSQSDKELNQEMFYQDRIPFNQEGQLRLFGSITELKDILSEPLIDMEVRIRLRTSTAIQLENKLIFSYVVFDSE